MNAIQKEILDKSMKLEQLNSAAPELLNALRTAPIHLLGETPEAFIERFKTWYREVRNPAIAKANGN